ncbi:deoxyribodipyrimidine photo-lyase [Paenibacillus sp. YYML68]|uniref:cryptochrome/photolyase family protein n=1 Tax=Paenibacillus sp. YYML68 TaxID=2909250 RepID=UPI00248FE2A6|nr:deoxyribodipyrimidine photo-lyase [Paenibacillus sp. YYML68]
MLLFIHRKDLRIDDLPAFDYIRAAAQPSLHVLILDPLLLRNGRSAEHSGVNFLQHAARLTRLYREAGAQLHVLHGEPSAVLQGLLAAHPDIDELVLHEDVSPYALKRDRELRAAAEARGVRVTAFEEASLADVREFARWSGRQQPYKVYTPFYKRWREYVSERVRPASHVTVRDLATVALADGLAERYAPPAELAAALAEGGPPVHSRAASAEARPALAGAAASAPAQEPEEALDRFLEERLPGYAGERDRYDRDGTSRLSRHLNVGAISIRSVYERLIASPLAVEPWLRQLAWRDFYQYQARLDPLFFRYEETVDLSKLDSVHFPAWAEARTGIPIIDAAMTELIETGWMPNRLRMITAMFLAKNLGCPFHYGERYFRLKLSDYDNVLNRGGWLWCASLGFDAAPYFRIMNPVTQSQTHNPTGAYIRRWRPELAHLSDRDIHKPQPHAIVDLKASRAIAIETYKRLLRDRTSELPK